MDEICNTLQSTSQSSLAQQLQDDALTKAVILNSAHLGMNLATRNLRSICSDMDVISTATGWQGQLITRL
jgi:hypothetical protein